MHSFLFELGVEELPDNVILPASDYLKLSFEKMLSAEKLSVGKIKSGSTPRRLSIWADGLPVKQEDVQITKYGPSVSIAYDAKGNLSQAGKGFLKKSGAKSEDIYIDKTGGKEVLAVSFVQPGKYTIDLVRDWIIQVIGQIPLPKKMIWKDPSFAFSRPVRWLVALWDDDVISMDYHGIIADRISYGNRYLGLDNHREIQNAHSYEKDLEEIGVIVCREKRKRMIIDQCAELFANSPYQIKEDQRLLETVCNLVERPHAVVGEFDARLLEIPEKIITSTISQNQKYFSVYDSEDRLVNKFVFISNGDPVYSDKIREGNEKVVAARLKDAAWFFEEDCRRSLEEYLPLLEDVVFQSSLGTMAQKTERIVHLAGYIANELGLSAQQTQNALRAAKLCKADLVTLMLGEKEFTKLQGYIGMQYALKGGEDPEVAQAIWEHYMPRGSKDILPQTVSGAICAIADKLDTVVGIISVGLMPTGSADPFALRRAASGIVQIIADRAWELDLVALIKTSLSLLQKSIEPKPDSLDKILSFITQRVSWLLKEVGISYDVAAAVMCTGVNNLPDLIGRARALQNFKAKDDFIRLVLGFKRVANIIAGSESFAKLDKSLFEEEAERDLHVRLIQLAESLDRSLSERDYEAALQDLTMIAPTIDTFFDQVLVNCEDKDKRLNRYALLARIREEFFRVADLSQIVVESDINGE
nr:glycyl-tRNA synthetase beta chain [Candidatus Cloacimonadota bacterium]